MSVHNNRFAGVLLIIGFLVAGLSLAFSQSPSTESKSETFRLDPVHSMVLFRVHHQGAGQFWGRFNDVAGTVLYPRDDSSAPVFDVEVEVSSVDTGTAKLDRTLMSPDFFNGPEYPKITFRSSAGERVGEGLWKVTGDLTMLGETRPVTSMIEVTGVRGNPVVAKAGWEAVLTIDRTDFGMDWGVENDSLGDEVRLVIGLEGESGPPVKR
ncbi:MAG: YceI family protein [Phycisphaerales bacterium]|nr:YceI family protein [Phycisphaerales bacterium]|tara:strand:- start:11590 stop:12219 length:630 start_codon:yes stop_codon:yes gene_type:complete